MYLLVWSLVKFIVRMATTDEVMVAYMKSVFGPEFYPQVVTLVNEAAALEDKTPAERRQWVEAQLGTYVDRYGEYMVRACIEFVLSLVKK